MFKLLIKSLVVCLALAAVFLIRPAMVHADCNPSDTKSAIGCGVSGGSGTSDNGDSTTRLNSLVKDVLQILSAVVGVLAVIMLIVGGARYIASGGSDQGVQGAKKTITYAIIGLVVVALSQFVVHFVLSKTNKATSGPPSSMIERLTKA